MLYIVWVSKWAFHVGNRPDRVHHQVLRQGASAHLQVHRDLLCDRAAI